MALQARYEAAGRIRAVETDEQHAGPGEVRVRIERCGICGSDLHVFRGQMPLPASCPGHEMSGVVDEVGPGAGRLREGDRVAVEPLLRCGECGRCRRGDYHLCAQVGLCGLHAPGGMASHLVVPAYTAFPLPESVDFELGALAEPMAVAVHALLLGGIGPDSRVLVLGAGTIGLVAVAAARHLGAAAVGVGARHPHQRRLAEALGADAVLDPENLEWKGPRPDLVIETVGGRATTVADGANVVANGGTIVVVGLFEETPAFDPVQFVAKELRLVGSMVYNRPRMEKADFETALECIDASAAALRGLVTHTFGLGDVQQAFEAAADKRNGAVKVLLAPGAD